MRVRCVRWGSSCMVGCVVWGVRKWAALSSTRTSITFVRTVSVSRVPTGATIVRVAQWGWCMTVLNSGA